MDDVSASNIKSLKSSGKTWWSQNSRKVIMEMGFNSTEFIKGDTIPRLRCSDIGTDYSLYFTPVSYHKPKRKNDPQTMITRVNIPRVNNEDDNESFSLFKWLFSN